MRIRKAIVVVPFLLAACATSPSTSSVSSVREPVSRQVATTEAGKRAKAHADLGMEYLLRGNPSVALDEARSAVESDSSSPVAYNLMALVYMTLKDDKAAEENFKRALTLAPGDPEIGNNYGWFLCQSGHEEQSIPYFVAAASAPLYPTPTKPMTNAGICSMSIKDYKAAEGYLGRALRLDANNVDAQFLLADVCYHLEKLQEAQARLDDVHRRRDPTAQSDWLGLRIARKLGDREAENRYAGELRRKFGNSYEYQQLMQGRFE
jgi:type IV pilus assembly protein PilF